MPDLDNGLSYPLNSAAADLIGSYIEDLARDVRALFVADLRGNRPAHGKPGRRFWATDAESEWLDTGTAWRRLSVPAGATLALAGSVAPAGYVLLGGQEISRTGVYADLYAVAGSLPISGPGDGSTTWRLPDLVGRAIGGGGVGQSVTIAPGAQFGSDSLTLTEAQIPPLGVTTYGPTYSQSTAGVTTGGTELVFIGTVTGGAPATTQTGLINNGSGGAASGAATPVDNRQATTYLPIYAKL